MSENLRVEKFRNGDIIPMASNKNDWNRAAQKRQPAWCYLQDDSTNSGYGKIYNWYAVVDSRGLAPEGWHVPSQNEWETLIKNCSGSGSHRSKLNQEGFNTNFSGQRNGIDGSFLVGYCTWWSSTSSDVCGRPHQSNCAWHFGVSKFDGELSGFQDPKGGGYHVRCLKD